MTEEPVLEFPSDFVFGVATASYQIEGATREGGRGEGNWDAFCKKPGAIYLGDDASRACDHYVRYREDLDHIHDLGVSAYRFGVSWPRVIPEGKGTINETGLDFYERLVDGLLARGVVPYLTLFHWDYPQALEREGGWRNPQSPDWFSHLTDVITRRLGDRVRHYFTLNEPHAYIEGGLKQGRHAPGGTLPQAEVLLAGHHTLLAHGKSAQIIRANVKDSWVAMAPVLISAIPETESSADVRAAQDFTFSMSTPDLRVSSWWMDPALGRGYPEDGLRIFGSDMPKVPASDMDLIAQPLDCVGFNLYDAQVVRAGDHGQPEIVPWAPGAPRTAFNWPVTPKAHYYGPRFAFERYQKPVMITENGLSCRDHVHVSGEVPDEDRVDFIVSHLSELSRASADGTPVLGYFHWSLLDNFEWNHGYRERFGLVHVDYETMVRTKKRSFFAYRDLIAKSRANAKSPASAEP